MERIWKPENELRAIAEQHSRYVHVRTMHGGNSHDTFRKATKRQQEVLYGVIYGALLGMNYSSECRKSKDMERVVVDTAEFQADILMRPLLRDGEEFQGYMGVYLPLMRILDKWERQ